MAKEAEGIQDFLNDIAADFWAPVEALHSMLAGQGCTVKLQEAKSGHVVTYADPATKKALANFVSRKKGPVVRIYGDNIRAYMEVLETLPEGMVATVEKAPVCKRLVNPTACNSRCAMGFEFILRGQPYQKCRYNALMFFITPETLPGIRTLLEQEFARRAA